jgi:hypothetical protein
MAGVRPGSVTVSLFVTRNLRASGLLRPVTLPER